MKLVRELVKRTAPQTTQNLWYRYEALRYVEQLNLKVDPAKNTILILNHFFDQDIRALELANDRYNLLTVDAPTLFRGARLHFPEAVQRLMVPYQETPVSARLAWRSECKRIIDALRARYPYHLLVVCHDNFYWIREFIAATREYGIKTVIIDKEGTISPAYFETGSRRNRELAPCISDHVYVWSERQKDYWQASGVGPDKITVIGQPRSDLFLQEIASHFAKGPSSNVSQITFFSYDDHAYIPLQLAKDGLNWKKLKEETNHTILSLAENFPGVRFVLKTHPQQPDLEKLAQQCRLRNIEVIGGSATANSLIANSDLIVAFQTTAVLEAILLGKRVIYTGWDANVNQLRDDILPFHDAPGLVNATSPHMLQSIITNAIGGDFSHFALAHMQREEARAFVGRYFHQPDGNVCKRFFEHVERFIQ